MGGQTNMQGQYNMQQGQQQNAYPNQQQVGTLVLFDLQDQGDLTQMLLGFTPNISVKRRRFYRLRCSL